MLSRSSPHPPAGEARPTPLRTDIARPDADTLVITPTGEADLCTMPHLLQALHDAIGAGRPHLIVDLDRLTFMDATTLGVLVDARLRISAAGETQVRRLARHHRRMLTITGLDYMLH